MTMTVPRALDIIHELVLDARSEEGQARAESGVGLDESLSMPIREEDLAGWHAERAAAEEAQRLRERELRADAETAANAEAFDAMYGEVTYG